MAKVNIAINASGNAEQKLGSLTKSIISAQLAVDLIKRAFSQIADISKEAIDKFVEQEKVETQLNAVLKSTGGAAGVTAREMLSLASSLQDVTNFGDEAIIGAENILLTFTKIGGEVIPEATESVLNMAQAMGQDLKQTAIQVGKALNDPVLGVTALRRVGVQLTKQQAELVKQLVETGDTAGAQRIIMEELATEFGNSARAARQTFGGALKSLENVQGDVLEGVGKIISVIGIDFVNSMIEGTKAVKDFINNVDLISSVGASFEVFKSIISDLTGKYLVAFKKIFAPIVDLFRDLKFNSDKLSGGLLILNGTLEAIGLATSVASSIVAGLIKSFIGLGKLIVDQGKAIGDFFTSVANRDFKGAGKAVKSLGENIKDYYVNLKDIGVDIVKNTIDDTKKAYESLKADGNKYTEEFIREKKRLEAELTATHDAGVKERSEITQSGNEENRKELEKSLESQRVAISGMWDETSNETAGKLTGLGNSVLNAMEGIREIAASGSENIGQAIAKGFQVAFDAVAGVMSSIRDLLNNYYEKMGEENQQWLDDRYAQVDEDVQRTLELNGLAEETEIERNQREIDELKKQLATTSDLEKKKLLQDQINEKQDTVERLKIYEDGEKTKKKLDDDFQKKEEERKRKQFAINKAFSIADIWVKAASAIMGFWAAYASIPFAGIGLASAATAVVTTLAGVQTGLVAAQQFAEGGIVAGNQLSGDNVPIRANSGEAVLMKNDFQMLVDKIRSNESFGGGNTIIIENANIYADDPISLMNQLDEIKNFELAKS